MVFFVCGACGESLRKNQVDCHPYRCRGCQYVTCMDCSKDFWGNDYANHNSCITEDQKYGGVNYVAKEMVGQKKQDMWVTQIRDSISSARGLKPSLKNLLENILHFDNIPRKRAKFLNFLRNNNYRNERLIEEAWEFIETVSGKKKAEANNSSNKEEHSKPSSMEVDETEKEVAPPPKSKRERKEERQKKQTKVQKKDKKKKRALEGGDDDNNIEESEKQKKKKHKREEEGSNQENEEPENLQDQSTNQEDEGNCSIKSSPFKWKKAITTVLRDAPEEGMKMKKFKRKVFALYMESRAPDAYTKPDVEIEALIAKKLQCRNDKYVVHKDRVKLRKSD